MEEKKDVKPDTYAKAGVDIRKEGRAIKGITNWVEKTFKFRDGKKGKVMAGIGGYANLVDIGEYALALCVDSVGSKVLVAQELEKYDTVGIDLVAMNVNDMICVGAEPISMVDYLGMTETNYEIAKEISIGLYEGAKQAGISIVGGETATLPEIIKGVGNRGFDLAGTAVGLVEKDRIITGDEVSGGDAVVGIKSSGIHSNGLTLARKILPKNMWHNLLDPTRIYVKEVLSIIENFDVHGLAHITGSGLLNLLRLTELGFTLDGMPEPQLVFKKIQELGKVSDEEMYRTFNMGVGFCVILDEDNSKKLVEEYGREYGLSIIGSVSGEPGVRITKDNQEIILKEKYM